MKLSKYLPESLQKDVSIIVTSERNRTDSATLRSCVRGLFEALVGFFAVFFFCPKDG